MRLEVIKTIQVPKEAVFAWWTDLVDTDSNDLKPLRNRQVLAKEDSLISTLDTVKILGKTMRFSVKVTLYPPDRWEAYYKGKIAVANSVYDLKDIPDGTKMIYSTEIKAYGKLVKIGLFISKFIIKRIFSKEMDSYIEMLEKEWREGSIKDSKS